MSDSINSLTPQNLEEYIAVFTHICVGDPTQAGRHRYFCTWKPNDLREELNKAFEKERKLGGFYTDHAIVLGEVTHPIFNKSVRYAEEYICRSTGQDGIAVRQAFTDWAFGKGARIVLAHNLPLADDQRSLVQREQIMSHNGWEMFSQVWCKCG